MEYVDLAEPDQPEVQTPPNTPPVHRFIFDGKGSEMFLLMVVNFILTSITFGIYKFWAATKTRKYIWSHISFHNDRLEYTGTGKELYFSFLKLVGIFFLAFGAFVGLGKLIPGMAMIMGPLSSILLFLLIGFVQYSARNYRLSRTRWRGIRMGMAPARIEFMKQYILWSIVKIVTLGLASPVMWVKLRSILINNTRIGNTNLSFHGNHHDIFGRYIMGIILSVVTLGIYYPWHAAYLMRYEYGKTRWGQARFKCVVEGEDLLLLYITNFVLMVITFGLAAPWVIKNNLEFKLERIAAIGELNLESISQIAGQGNHDAIADEAAGFLDVDFGF